VVARSHQIIAPAEKLAVLGEREVGVLGGERAEKPGKEGNW
jgi:hypothetical protein